MINIIGGGPAGCHAACLLAEKGQEVRIFEGHAAVGSPVHCTGLLTDSIKDFVSLEKGVVINKLRRARIHHGKSFFETKISDIVIDRKKFDQSLADKATAAGCEILLNNKFVGIEEKKLAIKQLNNHQRRFVPLDDKDLVIGADGPNSLVRRYVDQKTRLKYLTGVQARAYLKNEGSVFDVYLDAAPGFFAWVVPEDENIVRIGLASEKMPSYYFRKFLASKGISDKNIIELQGGLIPVYNPDLRVQNGNLFLLGDSAAQVKATTGGGIIPGMAAAECLARAITSGKSYAYLLNESIKTGMIAHLKLRKMLDKISSRDLNYLINLCSQPRICAALENVNRDNPLRLLASVLLREPRLLMFAKYFFQL